MRKIILILTILLLPSLSFAQTYKYDFESGTAGNEADQTYNSVKFDATSKIVYNADHVKNGSLAARALFDANTYTSNTEGYINYPNVSIVDGTTEIWWGGWFYLGEAADNPSGSDWSWDRVDTAQNAVIKWFRQHKVNSSNGVNNGYISIYGTGAGSPRMDVEYGGEEKHFQDTPAVVMSAGQWYAVEGYCLLSTSGATGNVKMWIDNVLKVDSDVQTLDSSSNRAIDFSYLFTYWNGMCTKNQYCYVDDLYISFDGRQDIISSGGSDTTAPNVTGANPSNGATGIALTSDIYFELNDQESGIDDSSIVVSVEGIDESADVTLSGDASLRGVTLANADISASLTYSQVIDVVVDVSDNATNAMAQTSYSFTLLNEPSASSWGAAPYNVVANYTNKNEIWNVVSGSWDIITTDFLDDNGALGTYSYYSPQTYDYFTMTFEAKSNENLATNAYADYDVVFGYVDDRNYYFAMFNKDSSSCGVFRIQNGERTDIVLRSTSLVVDNNFNTVTVTYDSSGLKIYHEAYGAAPVFEISSIIQSGYVGVGSYNDAASFDDISITAINPLDGSINGTTQRISGEIVRWSH